MKMSRWSLATTLFALVSLAGAGVVSAQETDAVEESTERAVEANENGRVVDADDETSDTGRVVVRVRTDGREVAIGPRRRVRVTRPPATRLDPHMHPRRMRDFTVEVQPPDLPPIGPFVNEFTSDTRGNISVRIQEHREVAQLDRESRQLAAEVRRTDGEERAELETQLRIQLDEIFEKKMEVRREQVQHLENRLQEQRAELDDRADARAEIIERRYQELLGESDALDW